MVGFAPPTAEAAGLVTVWLNVVPEHEQDLNDWYAREHLAQVVALPGFVRARRYNAVGANPRYLTAYELTDRDAFESPEGLQARKTPWTAKMRSLFFNTRRRMCRLITPTMTHEQALGQK